MTDSTEQTKTCEPTGKFPQWDSIAGILGVGAAFVICVSACLITIQCFRVSYMPTLSLAASSSTITGIFLTSLAFFVVVVASMLSPSLGMVSLDGSTKTKGRIARQYSVALLGILVVLNGVFWGYAALLGVWDKDPERKQCLNTAFLVIFGLVLYLFAWRLRRIHGNSLGASDKEISETNGSIRRFGKKLWKLLGNGLILNPIYMLPALSALVPLILALAITQPARVSPGNALSGTILCILIAALNWVALERPEPFAKNAAIATAVFALVWSAWLSPAVFRVLGLGNRTIQTVTIDSRYRRLMEQMKFSVLDKDENGEVLVQNAWLSLRLGDQILIATSPSEAEAGRSLVLPAPAVTAFTLEGVDHKFQLPKKAE